MDELLNDERRYNWIQQPDKYTAEEFLVIYNERVKKLYDDLPILKGRNNLPFLITYPDLYKLF